MDSQNPNPSNDQNSNPNLRPQSTSRRPRGIAARMAGEFQNQTMDSQNPSNGRNSNPNRRPPRPPRHPRSLAVRMAGGAASATANNSRMFLERERRAITARMLDGLRQYGNFNLPARAGLNLVVGALARESGFTVDPDGTTYRSPVARSNVVSIKHYS